VAGNIFPKSNQDYFGILTGLVMSLPRIIIIILLTLPLAAGRLHGQSVLTPADIASTTSYFDSIRQGYQLSLLLNGIGMFGKWAAWPMHSSSRIGMEYPIDSKCEHLNNAGIWCAALVDTVIGGQPQALKRVSTSDFASGYLVDVQYPCYISEMSATDTLQQFIVRSSTGGDVDAKSNKDIQCTYTDTTHLKYFPKHLPLGLKVKQMSYSWAQAVRSPIIPVDFTIVNIGRRILRKVFIGFYVQPWVGTPYNLLAYSYNVNGFLTDVRTAYTYTATDPDATPLGVTLLDAHNASGQVPYSFRSFDLDLESNTLYDEDSVKYNLLSGIAYPGEPPLSPDQSIGFRKYGPSYFISAGPFDQFVPGDTIHMAIAFLSGFTLSSGNNSLRNNALQALTLYSRGYIPPTAPPAPKIISIDQGTHTVTLRWASTGTTSNPENRWDDASRIDQYYPPEHWRRSNPPSGHTTGGRPFNGYRIYRSEDPAGLEGTFTPLREWPVIDSVGPHPDNSTLATGLEYSFTDSNLVLGRTYWYSVTSFDITDKRTISYEDANGDVKTTTLSSEGPESSVLATRTRVKMLFAAGHEPGTVKVVPNPYKVSENYTFEGGGYEGREKMWTEDRRVLKFIHLPVRCTLRIYSLSGDVVATFQHDDPVKGELDWDLKSESGRVIASGIYIFTVESDLGSQIGKFVVIR
jgi:hypothetical protein